MHGLQRPATWGRETADRRPGPSAGCGAGSDSQGRSPAPLLVAGPGLRFGPHLTHRQAQLLEREGNVQMREIGLEFQGRTGGEGLLDRDRLLSDP